MCVCIYDSPTIYIYIYIYIYFVYIYIYIYIYIILAVHGQQNCLEMILMLSFYLNYSPTHGLINMGKLLPLLIIFCRANII